MFVAHSVLEEIGTIKELWRRVPLQQPVDAQYWRVPPGEVPRTEPELIEWLYAWWEKIDAWIDAHKLDVPPKTRHGQPPKSVVGHRSPTWSSLDRNDHGYRTDHGYRR